MLHCHLNQQKQLQPLQAAAAAAMATSPGYLLHLIAWAQIGVLIRVYLEVLLGNGCSPSHPWIPCITSNGSRTGGAFFVDLPINVAGSFLMGLFVSSDVLSNSLRHTLTVEAPVAMLPVRSPLQTHLPFQVGAVLLQETVFTVMLMFQTAH